MGRKKPGFGDKVELLALAPSHKTGLVFFAYPFVVKVLFCVSALSAAAQKQEFKNECFI